MAPLASAGANASAKYAVPAALTSVLAETDVGGISLEVAIAIAVGLVAGAVTRASLFLGPGRDGQMRRDLTVSFMAGLANFIIAGTVVALGSIAAPGFPALAAAGVGMVVGFRGNDNVKWFAKRYVGITVDETAAQGRQDEARLLAAEKLLQSVGSEEDAAAMRMRFERARQWRQEGIDGSPLIDRKDQADDGA